MNEVSSTTPALQSSATTGTPSLRAEETSLGAVLRSVFRAPREDNGEEDSECSGIRLSTAEDVSSRALVGRQEHAFFRL